MRRTSLLVATALLAGMVAASPAGAQDDPATCLSLADFELHAATIVGTEGNDTLTGGPAADTLAGGTGDDTYVVSNTADTIVENAAEGTDTVRSSATYDIDGTQLENITLTGSAAVNATGSTSAKAQRQQCTGKRLYGHSSINPHCRSTAQ